VQFDEGIAGLEERYGSLFALPATAEKGYMDVTVQVETPGGHSSYPPEHTASEWKGIGVKNTKLTRRGWLPFPSNSTD